MTSPLPPDPAADERCAAAGLERGRWYCTELAGDVVLLDAEGDRVRLRLPHAQTTTWTERGFLTGATREDPCAGAGTDP